MRARDRRGATLSSRTFDRILIIKPSSLGDVVHALPVLHGLRGRFPNARIDWLVAPAFAPLLEGNTEVNNLVIFDRKRYGRIGRSPAASLEFFKFVQELRANSYQLVVDLQGLFRTGFLAWASGAAVRIGPTDSREGARVFYNHRFGSNNPDMHAVNRNYLVADLLGFARTSIDFNFATDQGTHEEVDQVLREIGWSDQMKLVVVVPGARWETKVWHPERFAETIDSLHADDAVRCLLLGAQDEVDLCSRVASLSRSQPVNLAGKTSIRQMSAIIERADVVLCHDSGPMHLAAALGRPLVCLTGPTNPLRTGPYGRNDDVIRVPLPCSPCYLRRLSKCRHEHQCMNDLSVAQVSEAVRKRLSANATRVSAVRC